MTAIIILNWNGADDTLACLQSLSKAEGKFVVYVVDNGSSDDSLTRIQAWIDAHVNVDVHLVPLGKNYGFARGNNKGLEIARQANPDSYLLLNNDTEVCPDFLVRLETFSKLHPECRVLTPKINFYYDKQKIWNCGGKLSFGFRKYHYAGAHDSAVREEGYMPISFVTGCALYFYPELLDEQGHLLTERFFFGEEDLKSASSSSLGRDKTSTVLLCQMLFFLQKYSNLSFFRQGSKISTRLFNADYSAQYYWAFLVAQMINHLPAVQEAQA